MSSRVPHRLASWIAALAILLTSFAPWVSHALGPAQGAAWAEICSAHGATRVEPGGDASRDPFATKHPLAHCPYCSLHATALGLPPSPVVVPLRLGLRDERPAAFLAAPRTLAAWVSAQPRAPPAHA